MRKKKRYKKILKKKSWHSLRFFRISFFIAFLFLLILILPKFFSQNLSNSIVKITSPLAKNQTKIASYFLTAFSPSITPLPTLIPSVFPTVEPTQAPLPGFCLKIPVLMYHHIQPWARAKEKGQTALSVDNEIFDQQLSYLISNGYTVITPDELINALRTNSQVLSKSIVITLDDGYRDIYEYAYPILKKYNLKASLAIPTGLMEGSDYLTWPQIEEMGRSGLVSFMNHTWSHYSLGKADIDKIKYEITTAKQQLEQHGQSSNIFVYPYGSLTNKVIEILGQNGFAGAFSTTSGIYQCDSFIMSLHRTRIGNAPLSYFGL